MNNSDFLEFLNSLRSWDDRAWNELVAVFDGPLRAYARVILSDLGLRKEVGSTDLAQTVYRRFLAAVKTTPFTSLEDVRRWMFRTLLNRARDIARTRRLQALPDGDIAGSNPTPIEQVTNADEQDELKRVMEALPKEQRRCAHLKYIEGLTWAEVAKLVKGNPECAHALEVDFHRKLRAVLKSLGLTTRGERP